MQTKRSARGQAVLVVEDEAAISLMLESVLEQLGYDVVGPAYDLASAIALVEKRQVDCAMLDIHLGEGTVYEFAELLEKRGIPFIFATGYDRIDSRFSHIPVIRKPFAVSEVDQAVRKALTSR
jgi:CheY-like chemotaxis protein